MCFSDNGAVTFEEARHMHKRIKRPKANAINKHGYTRRRRASDKADKARMDELIDEARKANKASLPVLNADYSPLRDLFVEMNFKLYPKSVKKLYGAYGHNVCPVHTTCVC